VERNAVFLNEIIYLRRSSTQKTLERHWNGWNGTALGLAVRARAEALVTGIRKSTRYNHVDDAFLTLVRNHTENADKKKPHLSAGLS
jgi:hypothetical protein